MYELEDIIKGFSCRYPVTIHIHQPVDRLEYEFRCNIIKTQYWFSFRISILEFQRAYNIIPIIEKHIDKGVKEYEQKKEKEMAAIDNSRGLAYWDSYATTDTYTTTASYSAIDRQRQLLQQAYLRQNQHSYDETEEESPITKVKKKFKSYVEELRHEIDKPLESILV